MNLRTKKILAFIFIAAASASLTAFIFLAATAGVRIQTAHAPFLNRIYSFFVSTSMTTKLSTSSLIVAGSSPTPAAPSETPTRQPAPTGFKGPTGPPHIKGPTGPPPNY